MTDTEMLKTLIDCCEKRRDAWVAYKQFVGGGAAQSKKNKLFKEYETREGELENAIFNIKQFIK